MTREDEALCQETKACSCTRSERVPRGFKRNKTEACGTAQHRQRPRHRNRRKQSTSAAADKPKKKHAKMTKVKNRETTTDTLLRRATRRRRLRPKRHGRDRARSWNPQIDETWLARRRRDHAAPGGLPTNTGKTEKRKSHRRSQRRTRRPTGTAQSCVGGTAEGRPAWGPRAAHEAATPGPQRASNNGT